MAPTVHHRSSCDECGTDLVHLAGDPSVGYEEIDPLEGGPRTLVEHTARRCAFHSFLTPTPGRHVLPGNADWLTKDLVDEPRGPALRRWERTDGGS